MIKIWSELRVARLKEQVADLATLVWVVFWGNLVWQLFQLLAGFAQAGRTIHSGGQAMVKSGVDIGESLSGLPLIGQQVQDVVRNAMAGAGRPISEFGTDLERFILVVSIVLALLFALATIGPWLSRYVPWRWERLPKGAVSPSGHPHRTQGQRREGPERARDAGRHPARLRDATRIHAGSVGDWASGRHDRLARAELASVGLRP